MNRITEAERIRFHSILDDSIDKLNSPKNIDKEHWKYQDITDLCLRQKQECDELEMAVFNYFQIFNGKSVQENIESECYDNINFPLMIIDNLRGNK